MKLKMLELIDELKLQIERMNHDMALFQGIIAAIIDKYHNGKLAINYNLVRQILDSKSGLSIIGEVDQDLIVKIIPLSERAKHAH